MGVVIFYAIIAVIVYGIYQVRKTTLEQIDSTPDEEPFPGTGTFYRRAAVQVWN